MPKVIILINSLINGFVQRKACKGAILENTSIYGTKTIGWGEAVNKFACKIFLYRKKCRRARPSSGSHMIN